jgi:hypothetical protein
LGALEELSLKALDEVAVDGNHDKLELSHSWTVDTGPGHLVKVSRCRGSAASSSLSSPYSNLLASE